MAAEKSQDWVEFKVSDQGRGIPASQIAMIFERFHQVDGTMPKSVMVQGLGCQFARSSWRHMVARLVSRVKRAKAAPSGFGFRIPLSQFQLQPNLGLKSIRCDIPFREQSKSAPFVLQHSVSFSVS